MKYYFIAIILFSAIFIWNNKNISGQGDTLTELEDMIETSEANGFGLESWSHIIREKREIPDINSFITNVEGYSFKEIKNESAKKFVADGQNNDGVNESILIVETGIQQYQIIYEIASSAWSEEVRNDYNSKISQITDGLFTSNAQNFTCVEAITDDIIDIVCLINKITEKLQISTYTQLKDSNFTTWTGHTPKWDQEIEIDNHSINAQIAVKNAEDNRTTLIIGTPILVTEY
ncbi:YwmB family TATA-box binding protein [Gracilibacillus xinjiangensis]|uniref:YwmB family TATA-box binding protein n=1 Tax=Gracilibacillus xinjiangensis TaxID=1193282 RepID=A0ABV8WTG4_9BACI